MPSSSMGTSTVPDWMESGVEVDDNVRMTLLRSSVALL